MEGSSEYVTLLHILEEPLQLYNMHKTLSMVITIKELITLLRKKQTRLNTVTNLLNNV
jgi:hypothetical protein